MDCGLPGSSVHGIFQARAWWSGVPLPSPEDLPNPGIKPGSPALQVDSLPEELPGKPTKDEVLLLLSHFSRVRFFATPWTVAYQAPLSMGFPRQEY